MPQDILVVTFRRDRASEIVAALSSSLGAGSVHCPFEPENSENKDGLLMRPNKITVSTVASAKGYDAPYVIVASLEDFTSDVEGRASLYVACTRARKWLDVNASGSSELTLEFQEALRAVSV